ncbi:hypothetical protein RRG08_052518 [Elysia crispata]|uniref:Uncharacterized protein n=1 Tax=Elysia crispata TaxID=231223 RepID=A0AAE0ZGU8_9GAST|nr:hypothetical protein RRG08_052518 [Elysia crispata]
MCTCEIESKSQSSRNKRGDREEVSFKDRLRFRFPPPITYKKIVGRSCSRGWGAKVAHYCISGANHPQVFMACSTYTSLDVCCPTDASMFAVQHTPRYLSSIISLDDCRPIYASTFVVHHIPRHLSSIISLDVCRPS